MGSPDGGVELRKSRTSTRRDPGGDGGVISANGKKVLEPEAAKRDSSYDRDDKWRCRVSRSLSLDRNELAKEWQSPGGSEATRQDDHLGIKALAFIILGAITYFTMPTSLSVRVPTVQHVWYYGWLSALSTGVGTIPLFLWSTPSNAWMGISNAIAAGMMISASFSLVEEGTKLEPDGTILFGHQISHLVRVVGGVLGGMTFVFVSKKYLEDYEDLTIGDLKGLEAAKMLLIVGVMTLHSFAEGLGIGVSFCGANGSHLGVFISASLAVHNVPEGLAVALVLIPRGVSRFRTLIWSIFTSLPQPVIAAPVFLFVDHFISWEPVGLGFAAGAMFWVACFELVADAVKEIPVYGAGLCMALSFGAMMLISGWIDSGITSTA